MKKIRILLCLAMAIMCVFVLTCCTPEQPPVSSQEPASTPTPAPGTSQEAAKNFIKTGETYRILIWANAERENGYLLDDESPRGEEAREHWYDYQDKYGITIVYPVSPATWQADVRTSAAGGDPICDIFHCGGPFMLPLLYNHDGNPGGILYSMDDFPEAGDFTDNEYWNVSAEKISGKFDNKLYFVIPQETGFAQVALNQVTFFNSDLIQMGGYTAEQLYKLNEEGQWTVDKLKEVAIACCDPDNGIYGMNIGYECGALWSLAEAFHGGFIEPDEDGNPVFLGRSAGTLQAIDFIVSLAQEHPFAVNTADDAMNCADAFSFSLGKEVIMLTYANRCQNLYNKKGRKVEFGVLMPPKATEQDEYVSLLNWFTPYCVMRPTNNPAGCVQILSEYVKPLYSLSSKEAKEVFYAETEAYFAQKGSMNTLEKIPSVSKGSAMFSYFQCLSGDNVMVRNLIFEHIYDWIEGALSADVYFEQVEDVINFTLQQASGMSK